MTVNEIKSEDHITLEIEGRVDTTTAPDLQKAVLTAFQKTKNLILQFEKVEYISSAGLRSLLIGQKTAMSKGGKMVVTGANEAVLDVFKVTGFINILTVE